MISSIELKNWRSHLDTKMDFSDGTNVLVGIVGAGKTSVLDGLCFGLFGTFPTLASKKVKLEDMIMKKPHKKEKAEILINFTVSGNDYSVKRIIQKGKTSAELRKNNKLIEAPQTQRVTEEVEKVLKINYDLFTRAVYSEQNQIDMFLTIPKGQRMKKIDDLLSIDKFETVRKNTVVLINRCFSLTNEKKKIIEGLESGQNGGGIESVKQEIRKILNDKGRMGEKLKSIKDKRIIQERKLTDLKKIDNRIKEIDQEEKTCIAIIQAYKADIDKLSGLIDIAEKSDDQFSQEISDKENNIKDLKDSLQKDQEKLLDIKKGISSKETELKILSEQKIPELKSSLEQKKKLSVKLKRSSPNKINKKINIKNKELDKEKEKLHRLSSRIEETEQTIKKMEEIEKRCPLCDQSLTESKKDKIIKLKRKRIERSLKSKEVSFKSIQKLEKELSKLNLSLKDSERLETQFLGMANIDDELKSSESIMRTLRRNLKELKNEEKMLGKTVSLLEKEFKKKDDILNQLKQAYGKKKELTDKTKKIKESQSKISILQKEKNTYSGFYSEMIPSIESELLEAVGMEKGLEAKIEDIEIIVKGKESSLLELEKKKKIIDSYKEEINKFNVVAEQLQLFESSVKSTQDQLRKNFITAVNQAMDEVWSQIYPYNDFYSCRLGVEGDYTLQLLDDTGWVNVDGIASGGERSIACLVLRIAFSLVLAPQLRWLVMDEPTHNLDRQTVRDFSNLLREGIPKMIEQIFIITHDPSLEGAVSGHLYKLDREKAKNEPTQVFHVNKE